LGGKFLDYILELAKDRGVKKVWTKFLPGNKVVAAMFEKRNFKVEKRGNLTIAEFELEE